MVQKYKNRIKDMDLNQKKELSSFSKNYIMEKASLQRNHSKISNILDNE